MYQRQHTRGTQKSPGWKLRCVLSIKYRYFTTSYPCFNNSGICGTRIKKKKIISYPIHALTILVHVEPEFKKKRKKKKLPKRREDRYRWTQNTVLNFKKRASGKNNEPRFRRHWRRERKRKHCQSLLSLWFISKYFTTKLLRELPNKGVWGPPEKCNLNTAISRKRVESYLFQNELV